MGQTAEELRIEAAARRADLSRDLDSIGDRISPGRMAERRKAMMSQRIGMVKERLMGVGESARSSTMHRMHDASNALHDGVQLAGGRTQEMAQGSPLAMGLVAFGAGLVIASLIPATEQEQAMVASVEPTLQKVAGEAASAARDLIDEVKPAVTEAADAVKSRAEEAVGAVRDA